MGFLLSVEYQWGLLLLVLFQWFDKRLFGWMWINPLWGKGNGTDLKKLS
tara:strand:+ start:165 stop:311 length:147 start_codon:yes stop_codon:yes gene_type:complete